MRFIRCLAALRGLPPVLPFLGNPGNITTDHNPHLPPIGIPGSLSLVLPAHNEEDNIEIVIRQALDVLPKHTDTFEIIPVNDGSSDATGRILDYLAGEDDRIRPVHHPVNRGYGGALKSGFTASRYDYVMFMDADRQFDIADIQRLAPFIPTHDIVAGFRMERSDPIHRRIFAEIFNLTVRVLFGVHLRDLDCAFKVFHGEQIRSLTLTTSGALINAEMQAKLRRQGATLQQVGVPHYPRVAGSATGGSPRVILRAMKETIELWVRMHRYTPPQTALHPRPYYALGDTLLGIGLGIGAFIGAKVFRRLR
ncbi:MAG TPA: glycosyltransferase family 2 protein [Thermomicrobiales bacterium]|nr:glycosyltransferase family 2 protein [Thermomicrobiales bacterium]